MIPPQLSPVVNQSGRSSQNHSPHASSLQIRQPRPSTFTIITLPSNYHHHHYLGSPEKVVSQGFQRLPRWVYRVQLKYLVERQVFFSLPTLVSFELSQHLLEFLLGSLLDSLLDALLQYRQQERSIDPSIHATGYCPGYLPHMVLLSIKYSLL